MPNTSDPPPLVSIIVRTKDRPRLLKAALRSIASQDYRPIEVILINDGGCDLTLDAMKQLLNDAPLQYVHFEKNLGRAAAGNAGILNARGEFVGFLDDDDEFCPDHISSLVSALEVGDYKIAYADSELILKDVDSATGKDEIRDKKVFASYDFSYIDLVVGNYIPLISVLFSNDILKESGGFDESFNLYEDWDLLLRISKDYPFRHMKRVTSRYCQWNKNLQIGQSAAPHVIEKAFSQIINKHHEKITPEVIQNLKKKQEVLSGELKDLIERHTELEHILSLRNLQLLNTEAELTEKNNQLSQKYRELDEKASEISTLTDKMSVLRTVIDEMKSTLGWRVLDKVRAARATVLPADTARGKFYQKVVNRIKGIEDKPLSVIEDIEQEKGIGSEPVSTETDSSHSGEEIVPEAPLSIIEPEISGAEIGEDLGEKVEPGNYEMWLEENEPGESDLLMQRGGSEIFLYKPLISIIVPVFETNRDMLAAMIESVRAQTYDNWQLCIAEGNSSEPYIREIIQSYIDKDSRITAKFLEENKFISGNSNEALSLAEGDFVGFLDHDDELAPFALFEVVRVLNDDSSIDFIYSDEDRIDVEGKRSLPFFKPDWSPDLLLSVNYICHFAVLRHTLLKELGGFRVGYEGAQDYDLFLRAGRKTSRIAHVAKIIYHWREHEKSTLMDDSRKDVADLSGKAVLNDYCQSNGIDAVVVSGFAKTNYLVRYTIKGCPFISIIIPFRDKVELLKKCVDSILEKTTYKEYELLLVSNRSVEEETFHYIDSVSENKKIKILYFDEEFNFSKLNNYAVRESRGEHLLFLNNDTEVITGDWMSCLLEHSQGEEIGAVGCKLLYPDRRIQHAGVVIGMTGFAGHVFAGLPEHYYNYFGFTDFVRNVMAVTGACMMVKRGLFEKAGGFQESFTICGSDVDFCLRIHEMGYRNIYIPHAVLYHHESASRGSFITPDDFELSLKRYKKYLEGRDPYYNPNLTLVKTDCTLKSRDEEKILREIRENAIKRSRDAGETLKEEEKHLKTAETINFVEALDFSIRDLDICRQRMIDFEKNRPDIKSINWFIPYFYHVYYGGIYTILRFADYFCRKGIKNRFVLYDSSSVSENDIFEKIQTAFPQMNNFEIYIRKDPDINVIPYADISFATLWTSAFSLLKFEKTRGKFYFIQDYEPLFYPAGTHYALAEATYRFGFYGIINTPGLYHFITNKYDMTAEYFVPAVDHHIFFPMEQSLRGETKKLKLFFYGRPQHDRNAFDLAVATARKIKAVLGRKIQIVSAGSEWNPSDYGVSGVVENIGLLGYRETAELYRTSDFGLILMFTKHPSYLPMELMASGSIVITNNNEATSWLLRDGINCICVEPSPSYITEKLVDLIGDRELQKTIRSNAIRTAASFSWEREMEKIYRFITGTEMISDLVPESSNEMTDAHIFGESPNIMAVHRDTRDMQAFMKRKGRDLVRIEHQLRRKDQRIDDLELSLRKKESILNNIYSSNGWRALAVYYKLRDNMLPAGSRRRKAVKSTWNFLNIISPKNVRLLTRDNISRSIPYIKNYGIRTFVLNVLGKLNSESIVVSKIPNVPALNLATLEEDEVIPYENATVSVIIPTKNAGSNFDLLLSMLREQKGVKDIEIIIVDSGSSDDTINMAKAYGARVIEVPPENFSHSHSRNAGAEASTGNYVFFTVQDALPPSKFFFHELLKVLTTNDIAAVSCAEFPREDVDLFYSVLLWNHYRFLEVDEQDRILTMPDIETHISLRKNGQLSDLACLMPKDLFMKYKYRFDYAEDLDLGIRLIRDSHKIAFLNSIPIIHSHYRSPYYFLKRGYVDNIFLTNIFPDYTVPSLQEDLLLGDILQTYHLLNAFILRDLSTLKTPVRVDELFHMADRKLSGISQHEYFSLSGLGVCPYMDDDFQSLLTEISEVSHVSEGYRSYDGILIHAVMNHMNIAKEYMASTYAIVDDAVLEDFKALIIKIFALQCGAHLAYCFLNEGSIVKKFHTKLKGGI